MNELDPIARPEIFDEPSWEALTPGQRVRLLREAEDRLALPLETYRALRELPSWAFYGPEHGLPPECFNELGFVLPRYRPGGSEHEAFQAWRRQLRLRGRIVERLWERWRERWRWWEPWLALLGALMVTTAGLVIRERLEDRLGDEAATTWMLAVWPGLWLGGALIALVLHAWAIPRLVGMLVDRIAARRARRPVASEGEPGT